MKIIYSCLLVLTTSHLLFAQPVNKAVFVIVDGIPADVVEKIETPVLDSIAAIGGYARAHVGGERNHYSQTPTISAVGYNSLLTGTWVNKHNVWDNDIAAPNYHYPTIFRFFKDQFPARKIAVFSSWLDNRTKLVGDGIAATGGLRVDFHYDGLELDSLHFPKDAGRNFMHLIDERVVDTASRFIRDVAPDLTWVYLEYTDDMGHMYGDSRQFYEAVRMMDRQISRIWDALQFREKKYNERWQIFITTDHGRTAKDGRGHGGQTDRERQTWIVSNADSLNDYFRSGSAAIVDIMPAIARHLGVIIPTESLREIDGSSITGSLSAVGATASIDGDQLLVAWKPLIPHGVVRILLASTNNFQAGGHDQYRLVATLPVQSGGAKVRIDRQPGIIYKVVYEFPFNTLNYWVKPR